MTPPVELPCPLRLPLGASAQLTYAADFASARLHLLECDEATLQEILSVGVVVKGAPEEEAVLCTKERSYAVKAVQTSNTLLLVPPPATASPAAPSAVVEAACACTSHFELTEVAPPLGPLETLLAGAQYGSAQEGAAGAYGFSWAELGERVQCSEAQLHAALLRLRALCLHGRWTTVEPGAAVELCAQAAPGLLTLMPSVL